MPVAIDFQLDGKSGSEFGWGLYYRDSAAGWEAADNFNFPPNAFGSYEICIPRNTCYEFIVADSGGDGICCNHGPGSYSFLVNGKEIFTGGNWTEIYQQHDFCIGTGDSTCANSPGNFYAYSGRRRVRLNCNKVAKQTKTCNSRLGCKRGKKNSKRCRITGNAYDRCPTTCGAVGLGPCEFLQDYVTVFASTHTSGDTVLGSGSEMVTKVPPVSVIASSSTPDDTIPV